MRIFALETDTQKIKERYLTSGEHEIFTAHPHVMSFLWHIAWEVFVTLILVLGCAYLLELGVLEPAMMIGIFVAAWFFLVFFGLVEAYIDWKYDFIFLTTDKLIIVDQMSLFRKSTTPINLENLGDVVAQTQWLNLFNFGIIHFALKEGSGPEIKLSFMPNADRLVAKIAEQITLYQRRKDYVVPYRVSNATQE
jgi:hypothetical protein